MMETTLILSALLRTTLFLSIGGLVCMLVLRRIGEWVPQLCRLLWLAVLVSGWFWVQPMIPIAYEPVMTESNAAVIATEEAIPQQPMPEIMPPRKEMTRPDHLPLTQKRQNVVEVQAASETTLQKKKIDWKPLILSTVFAVWLGGMVVSIFLAAAGYVRFLRQLRKAVPAGDDFAGPWRELLKQHGFATRTIPMLVSECNASLGPALIRTVFGYRLVVPRELWSELSEAGRCGILKHELAHFQRHDVWKSFCVRVLALPHWFNPIAHLAVHRFEEAAEQLCDRAAFDLQQEGALEFARTLLLLHENAPTQFVARQSIFGRGLKHRVACLLHENSTRKVSLMKKTVLISGTVILLAVCLFRLEFVEKNVALAVTNDNPVAENAAPKADSSEMVALRLTVVDEDENPVPGTLVQLKTNSDMVNETVILDLGQTDTEGNLNVQIPTSVVYPDTRLEFYQREKGLLSGVALEFISKTWKSPEPFEGTVQMSKARRITGIVVDSSDKPVAGAIVNANFCERMQNTLTDEKGRFEIDVLSYQPRESLYAFKPGVGAGMISPDFPVEEAWKATGESSHWEQWRKNRNDGPFTIKIERGEPITVKVVDPEGNPLEGILVWPAYFSTKTSFWNMWNFDEFFPQRTDKNGKVAFDWIPTQNYHIITFTAVGTDPRFEKESKNNRYGESRAIWRESAKNNDLVIQLPEKIMLEGSVKNADGTPVAPGMQISVTGVSGWSSCGHSTDYAGNFTFFVNANEVISMHPIYNPWRDPDAVGTVKARLNVSVGNGRTPAPRFDFVLEEGTLVKGKITKNKGKLDSKEIYVQIYDDTSGDGQRTDMNRLFVMVEVDENGEFAIQLPDGRFRFKVTEYKDGEHTEKDIDTPLVIHGETEVRFDMEI